MTKPFTIIALTGPKGAGKDTVADLLRTHADFYPLAFADALRMEVCDAFGVESVYLTHHGTKETPTGALALQRCRAPGFVMRLQELSAGNPLDPAAPRSPRQILQWWGTEYRRADDAHYWVQQLRRRLINLIAMGAHTRFVVTDCRFANEVDMLRNPGLDALLWQVQRPGCAIPPGAHVSETTGSEFAPDAVLDNSGDIKHLQQQVMGLWWAHDAGLERVRVEIAS